MSKEPYAETSVLFEQADGVAWLTLNRPDAGNAIDLPMAQALMQLAIICDEDPNIKCVVLTGTGRMFCAGGDISTFATAGADVPLLMKQLTGYLHMAIARFARMGKPMVTSINGPAAGGGLSLAVLGDIALAAPAAHFTLAYTSIGLSPDGGSTWLLPRLIGLRRAQELALTNRRVPAAEAAQIGLITRVVEPDRLAHETREIARTLADASTAALGRTRNLLLNSFATSLETQMESEARAIAECSRSPDSRAAIDRFLAKSKRRSAAPQLNADP
jgi:2-(1,2-epoxy-1,2-dihydrophenyl)acetyl-CoA isomerase